MTARRLAVALAAVLLAAVPASAEDNGLGNFFSHLFGGPPSASPSPRPSDAAPRPVASTPRPKPKKRAAPREASRDAPTAAATPPPTASKFVYVLGDSLAISAADGMAEDLQARPDIGVVDRARDASGLVRDDYFDWPKAARELLAPKESKDKDAKDKESKDKESKPEKPKIDVVVVEIGLNDMQQARDGKDYVDPLTDRWKAAYAQRIQALVAPFREAHVPVIWVGLPPMRSDKFNAQMIALNQLFKDNVERAGAKFLDIFDDFADQGGGFDAFGPNVEGQNVKLRGSDGIHFTPAGGKKLAHFIDAEVLAALGDVAPAPAQDIAALPPDLGKAADDINEQIRREVAGLPPAPKAPETAPAPKPPKPEAGAVASLAARPLSPGAALVTPASAPTGEAGEALRRGEPPPPAPGRADDFTR